MDTTYVQVKAKERENTAKKWIIKTFISLISMMLIIGIIIYKVDPFMYYRLPETNNYKFDQQYCNAGILKNADYDSAIVGSSMVHLFDPQVARDTMGINPAKLSWGGARPNDLNYLVNEAIKYRDAKTFLFAFDLLFFDSNTTDTSFERPEYLHDDNKLNDIKYLFNTKTYTSTAYVMAKKILGIQQEPFDIDAIHTAGYTTERFEKESALNYYDMKIESNKERKIPTQEEKEISLKRMKENLHVKILSLFEENPQRDFYVFFPPISILLWEAEKEYSTDIMLEFKEYAIKEMLNYDNVKLYDFQNLDDIVLNLDNYKDTIHYSSEICDEIIRNISEDKNLITKENYKEKVQYLRNIINQFDISQYDR